MHTWNKIDLGKGTALASFLGGFLLSYCIYSDSEVRFHTTKEKALSASHKGCAIDLHYQKRSAGVLAGKRERRRKIIDRPSETDTSKRHGRSDRIS